MVILMLLLTVKIVMPVVFAFISVAIDQNHNFITTVIITIIIMNHDSAFRIP